MQTDKIKIANFEAGRKKALEEAEKFSAYMSFDHKAALRVQLLVEEALSMVSTITEKFSADFWIEGKQNGLCRIHLQIRTDMDMDKKKELIAASKNKKNAAAKGLTGKIRELIEEYLYLSQKDVEDFDANYYVTGMVDMPMALGTPVQLDNIVWSLEDYRQEVDEARQKEEKAEEWDELEKSILANLADDVKVAVKGDEAELVVEKKF